MRLRQWMPERFIEVRDWEQAQRAKGGARATYAIARDQSNGKVEPLPLADLEARHEGSLQTDMFTVPEGAVKEDRFSCFCSSG
jgi:hypothetical protein